MGGQICAVLSAQYNSWFRGRIVQVYPTKNRATVFQIDYGQDEDVTFDNLRKDVGTVLEFHKLSYQLALKNVTWVGQRGEGTNILANKIVEQEVEVIVHETRPKLDPNVSAIVTIKKNDVNVAMLLKAEGAAKFGEDTAEV